MKKVIILLIASVLYFDPIVLISHEAPRPILTGKQSYPNISGVWVINEMKVFLSILQSNDEVFCTTVWDNCSNVWYAKGRFIDKNTIEVQATNYSSKNKNIVKGRHTLKLTGDNFISNYVGDSKHNTWNLLSRHK